MTPRRTGHVAGMVAAFALLGPAVAGAAVVRTGNFERERHDGSLLASVPLNDGSIVDFREVKPGVVLLAQHGKGEAAPHSLIDQLASTSSSEERYRILAAGHLDPAELQKIKASDVRRQALEKRYETGQEAPPRPVRASIDGAEATKSARYGALENCDGRVCEQEDGTGQQAHFHDEDFDYGGMWCPSEVDDYPDPNDRFTRGESLPVSGHLCMRDYGIQGVTDTGWAAPTKVWASMAWNKTLDGDGNPGEGLLYSKSTLSIWYDGQWQEQFGENNLYYRDQWVMYYSWHPYTYGGIKVAGGGSDDPHRINPEIYNYAAFWLNQ